MEIGALLWTTGTRASPSRSRQAWKTTPTLTFFILLLFIACDRWRGAWPNYHASLLHSHPIVVLVLALLHGAAATVARTGNNRVGSEWMRRRGGRNGLYFGNKITIHRNSCALFTLSKLLSTSIATTQLQRQRINKAITCFFVFFFVCFAFI